MPRFYGCVKDRIYPCDQPLAPKKPKEPVKLCSVCKRSLPLSKFGKNAGRRDGHDTVCRACRHDMRGEQHVMKVCSKCGVKKPISEFYREKLEADIRKFWTLADGLTAHMVNEPYIEWLDRQAAITRAESNIVNEPETRGLR